MKILAIVVSFLIACSTSVAQEVSYNFQTKGTMNPPVESEMKSKHRFERSELKGPRAKNHPSWKYNSSVVTVTPTTPTAKRVGPSVKNYRPWQNDTPTLHLVVAKKERKNLKGPRAKNHKPWDDR